MPGHMSPGLPESLCGQPLGLCFWDGEAGGPELKECLGPSPSTWPGALVGLHHMQTAETLQAVSRVQGVPGQLGRGRTGVWGLQKSASWA